jgi:hypothetical protein
VLILDDPSAIWEEEKDARVTPAFTALVSDRGR